jgi:two-component system NtrC family sensor kinase
VKIAVKQISVFLACIAVALIFTSVVGARRELDRIEADVFTRHSMTARVLRAAFRNTREVSGEERAFELVRFANSRVPTVEMRWVELAELAPDDRARLLATEELQAFDEANDRLRSYMLVPGRSKFPDGALLLEESRGPLRAQASAAIRAAAYACAGATLVAGIVAALFSMKSVGRPLRELTEQARRVGAGDFGQTVRRMRHDEIGILGEEMNRMAHRLRDSHEQLVEESRARLRALEELRHGDRLRTVGTLASGLAHELGTPLNIVLMRARSIESGRATEGAARDAARAVVEQAERMTELVRRLLDFARRRPPRMARVDIAAISEKAVSWLEGSAKKREVGVENGIHEGACHVVADTVQLEQVLTNLLANAIEACARGGHVKVSAEPVPGADFVRIDVVDDGAGIEEAILPRILEPFFTTKEPGDGTGLGLSIADGIVRDHGGWIEVQSAASAGSRFSVFLPGAAA